MIGQPGYGFASGFEGSTHRGQFASVMRREARWLHLGQAKVKYAVSDGAEWIANEYQRQLPMLDAHILDYYHLREHVIGASQVLYD